MRKLTSLSTFAAIVLSASATMAAPPYVSGKYAYSRASSCEPKLTTHKNSSGAIDIMHATQAGLMDGGIGYIVFTPSSSTSGTAAIIRSTEIEGGALRLDTEGFAWQQHSVNQSAIPYSVQETTFTLGGEVYQMVYGNLVSGIYRNVYLARRFSGNNATNPNCFTVISASKQ